MNIQRTRKDDHHEEKLLVLTLLMNVFAMTLSDCGSSKGKNEKKKEAAAKSDSETISLTVWGEEDTMEMLSGMVESFMEIYL